MVIRRAGGRGGLVAQRRGGTGAFPGTETCPLCPLQWGGLPGACGLGQGKGAPAQPPATNALKGGSHKRERRDQGQGTPVGCA